MPKKTKTPLAGGVSEERKNSGRDERRIPKDGDDIKQELIAAIQKCAAAGLSTLPVDRKTKTPAGSWKRWQSECRTPDQAAQAMQASGMDAMALICGGVSGNLECLDFDQQGRAFEPWRELVETVAPGLVAKLVVQRTQSGGVHAWYRVHGDVGHNQRLALSAPNQVLIETRAEGGYALVAPSPGYELLHGDFAALPVLDPLERSILIESARALTEWVDQTRAKGAAKSSGPGLKPGEDFNARGDVRALLERHGWTAMQAHGNREQWRRPGKDAGGWSATLFAGRILHVHSTNAHPFEAGQSYMPFAVFALLEHSGDFAAAAAQLRRDGYGTAESKKSPPPRDEPPSPQGWELAQKVLPRVAFPWHVLPPAIAESLKTLARSCATNNTSLPGYACCIVAAAVGRKASVRVKASWHEPLIFWHADVRDSGEGKTAPARLLMREFERRQSEAHARHDEQVRAHAALPRDQKTKTPEPEKARGFFCTNLTLEGIRQDLEGHPTAGLLVVLDELSALVNGQNQYKNKGTDREAWLTMHDGNPARIVRQSKAIHIGPSRVQVCGGIQPKIFRKCFAAEGGQFLVDGSIFRLLSVFEPATHFDQTPVEWSDSDAAPWHRTVSSALDWAESRNSPLLMTLTPEAQATFFDWRNELSATKADFPEALRGYVPKGTGYALRFAGVLQLMRDFAEGREPCGVIGPEAMQRGIDVSMFYLGQAVSAVQLLTGCATTAPVEISERSARLAVVLASLRDKTCNGRLAVGHVQEQYNAAAPEAERLTSPHATGGLLRSCGLTVSNGKHDANGRRGVRCMVWDGATEKFLADFYAPPVAPVPPVPEESPPDPDFWEVEAEATI